MLTRLLFKRFKHRMSMEYLRTFKETFKIFYLQFLPPGAFRGRVLPSGGEAGEGDAGVDVRSRLHPEMFTRGEQDPRTMHF